MCVQALRHMTSPNLVRSLAGLLGCLALTAVAAAIGGYASAHAGSFYQQLIRPNWAPPAWLFGPVWSALYLLMALAAWRVWRERAARQTTTALALYLVQLAANALWPWLFFAWRDGAAAFAEVVLLWSLILATLIAFWRIRPLAGALLIPYLVWVSFASALTWATWQRNPQLLS